MKFGPTWLLALFATAGCSSAEGAVPPAGGSAAASPAAVESSEHTVVDAAQPPSAARDEQPETAAADESEASAAGLETINLDPAEGALREQLMAKSRAATKAGKQVYLEMWASWCPPCKKVHRVLTTPDVVAELGGVLLIRVDTDAFGEDLDALGFTSRTIPAVYAVDKLGRPSGRTLSGHKWRTEAQVREALPAFLLAKD